jgi:DNA-binding CsgD family transcriptional regulator
MQHAIEQVPFRLQGSVQMAKVNPILTTEERDILILVASHPGFKHLSNSEIAQQLAIPVTRVKTLMHQACLKLGADNRNEAVFLAIKRGEINLDELLPLDELAEILSSLDPEMLRMIANLVRLHPVQKTPPEMGEQIAYSERRQAGVLTNRERDVLILVSYGLANTEIAGRLCITTSAVRTFLDRAFKKLGVTRRADALQLALKQREISVSEISSLDELVFFLAPLGADSIEKMAQLLDEKQANPK